MLGRGCSLIGPGHHPSTLKIELGQELHFWEVGGGVVEQVPVPVA
jgi:hypothetical protein